MLKFVPPGVHKVLEIGCAEGSFGLLLKRLRGVEVWGVDMSLPVADEAISRLDHFIVGDFEDENVDVPKKYFDCVVFNDVIEHFKYPWTVLRDVREYIVEGGYVVASIPNVRFLSNIKKLLIDKQWKYEDEGILDKTHLRFFVEESIRDMFKACDYRIIKLEGINAGKFSWKFEIINRILFNMFEDMRFRQFACVAQKE